MDMNFETIGELDQLIIARKGIEYKWDLLTDEIARCQRNGWDTSMYDEMEARCFEMWEELGERVRELKAEARAENVETAFYRKVRDSSGREVYVTKFR